ncbi:MAG: methyltransferase domain-containing protein [Cyanobacteria bacterium P01_A01_bin.40]
MSPQTETNTLERIRDSSSNERWQKAQCSELTFWSGRARSPESGDSPVGLARKADKLLSQLNISLEDICQSSINVLDLGCGPMGFNIGLHYLAKTLTLSCPQLFNLDPLIHDYREIYPDFRGITKADVTSVEELGANDKFEFIVLENVIDHIAQPKPIIRQLRDKLTDSGRLLITCHTIPSLLRPTEPILNAIDPPHPHHFTHEYLEGMIEDLGYSLNTSFTINLRESHPDFSLSTVAKQRSFRSLKRYSATWILNTSFIVAEASS